MTDDYNKKIGVQKEVLEALPRNNAKNNKLYKEKVIELKEQYDNDLMLLSEEIIKRKNEYMNALPDKKIDEITISMKDIYNKLLIGNCFNSSYEKSGLDKLLYRLGHFYTDTHEDINKNILAILDIFKLVGVSINSDDFCYSYYSNLYMKKLLSVISDDNRDDILKDCFDELYWKCPDIISHITLNFKYLYCINKKMFDEYYNNILSEVTNGNLRNNYSGLFIERENCIFNSKYLYMNDFINNKLDINDYSSDRIKKAYGYILNGTPNDDINEDVINLSYSLIEYKNYLRFKYIIDDIKNLYKEKDKYKGVYNSKKKEISKLEKKIFKQNRKIFKLANGNKTDKFNFYNSVVNEDINKLKTLYDELQDNYFLERVSSLNDDSTLYDVLYLVASNYNYLNLLMKKNNIDSKNEYNDLCEFVFYPHINILSNILINDERDIATIIIDRYNLFGFDLNNDLLGKDNLDNIIDNVNIIINSIYMNKLGINDSRIKFIKAAINMNLQ